MASKDGIAPGSAAGAAPVWVASTHVLSRAANSGAGSRSQTDQPASPASPKEVLPSSTSLPSLAAAAGVGPSGAAARLQAAGLGGPGGIEPTPLSSSTAPSPLSARRLEALGAGQARARPFSSSSQAVPSLTVPPVRHSTPAGADIPSIQGPLHALPQSTSQARALGSSAKGASGVQALPGTGPTAAVRRSSALVPSSALVDSPGAQAPPTTAGDATIAPTAAIPSVPTTSSSKAVASTTSSRSRRWSVMLPVEPSVRHASLQVQDGDGDQDSEGNSSGFSSSASATPLISPSTDAVALSRALCEEARATSTAVLAAAHAQMAAGVPKVRRASVLVEAPPSQSDLMARLNSRFGGSKPGHGVGGAGRRVSSLRPGVL